MTELTQLEQALDVTSIGKWKAYPSYKDSGVEWLGEIPEHWEIAPLYARYSIQLGKMRNQEQITGLTLAPYLRNVNIQWDYVDTADILEMDFDPAERRKYTLKYGDLLVCEGGEVGRTAIWRDELSECYIQNAVHRVRPLNHKEEGRFLFYILYMVAHQGVFESGVNRSTIGHLTSEKLKKYRFMFPPLPEQHSIATFLDRETSKINTLIAKKQRLIELLQEKRAAFISHAVTKGLDPDVKTRDSGVEWLGEIPEHWEVRRLKFVTSFITSGSRGWAQYYSDEGDIFLRIGNLSRTSISLDLGDIQHVVLPSGTEGERTHVKQDDVLISITAYIGSIGVVLDDLGDAYVNQHIALTRPRRGIVDSRWIGQCLLSSVGQDQFQMLLNGGTKDGLNLDDVGNLQVIIPPLSEQKTIANYLDQETIRIDALIPRIGEAIEKLKEYSAALISAAVTGKIDVRGEVASMGDVDFGNSRKRLPR